MVQHTPLGLVNFRLGAKDLTSSATPSLLRSVTAQTVVLRVPTKSMLVLGATAMWRASGTTANRSILKPGGILMRFRLARIASAFLPVCGTTGMFRSVVATFICLSFSMLVCARAGIAAAHARARRACRHLRCGALNRFICRLLLGSGRRPSDGTVRQHETSQASPPDHFGLTRNAERG